MASAKGGAAGAAAGAGIGSLFGGPLGAGVGAGIGGLLGLFGQGDTSLPMSPEVQQLLANEMQRTRAASPIYEAALRLAFDKLPHNITNGLMIPRAGAIEATMAPLQSGKYAQDFTLRQLLREQQVRTQQANPLYEAVLRLASHRLPVKYIPFGERDPNRPIGTWPGGGSMPPVEDTPPGSGTPPPGRPGPWLPEWPRHPKRGDF